jgi:hypothetical protein
LELCHVLIFSFFFIKEKEHKEINDGGSRAPAPTVFTSTPRPVPASPLGGSPQTTEPFGVTAPSSGSEIVEAAMFPAPEAMD